MILKSDRKLFKVSGLFFFLFLFIYLFAQDHHYNNTTYCNAINIILSGKSQKP